MYIRFTPVKSGKMSTPEKTILIILLVVALGTRLFYIVNSPELKLSHDEIGYHEMTRRFLEKGFLGYYSEEPSAYVTPGYPLFLAAVYSFAGLLHTGPLTTVRIIQGIISIGSVFLVYLIARKGAGPAAGFLAAVLAVIYPSSFMANNRILTEVLYTFTLLGYILSLITAFERQALAYHALSGALLAVAVLVRPAAASFLVVPYIVQFILRRNFRVVIGLLAAVTAFCLVMSPWWVRNYLLFDKFIMFATQSGDPILRGTDPYDRYDRIGPSVVANVPPAEKTKVAFQRIKEGLKTDPWLWIKWFTVGKLSFLWLKPWGVYTAWAKGLHFWVFVVMGWLGAFFNLFDSRMRWPALFVVFSTLIQLAFIPIERYMYPLTHIMAIMAAVLLVKIVRKVLTLQG